MGCDIAFIIGAPRSGTTLLERTISGHSSIKGGAEPHLLTPLAHLGVWNNVDKAPYDHIVASIGQRDFVEKLPGGVEDYWKACRAYAQSLYDSGMGQGQTIFLDKTPEYATIWPFLKHIFPDAKYIVLSRHPAAIFSSFANSFFDGNYQVAQDHDPLFERYIPAISAMLRDADLSMYHLRYEDFVADPASHTQSICEFLGVPFQPSMIDYGSTSGAETKGLGDPIGLAKHSSPSAVGVDRWAEELAADEEKYRFLKLLLERIDSDDLQTFGYSSASIWEPVESVLVSGSQSHSGRHSRQWTTYKIQRKLIIAMRSWAQSSPNFRKLFDKLKLTCEVILREY